MLGKAAFHGMHLDKKGLAKFLPDPHDQMHESPAGFWKLRGERVRKIPPGAKIHASVFKLPGNRNNGYRPENLPICYEKVQY